MRPILVFGSAALLCASTVPLGSQTLGQLAAEEAQRRQAIPAPARVITNFDLAAVAPPLPRPIPTPDTAGAAAAPEVRRMLVSPASYQGGTTPAFPVLAVSGGEVMVELSVDRTGRVTDVAVLRDTPGFTPLVQSAVRGWRFQPAEDAVAPAPGAPLDARTRRAIDSRVLVIGLFRPPALFQGTLGQPPVDTGAPSAAVPAPTPFPAMPALPPQTLFDGVVLTEVHVTSDGSVGSTRFLQPAPGLDGPTLDVIRGLRFRPARVLDTPSEAFVYVITAFRQPIIQ
jgi:outer membrane biosynthesis protein TonB